MTYPDLITFDQWQNEMERQFDTMPSWWWKGRTRRLAEYGEIMSRRIEQARAAA